MATGAAGASAGRVRDVARRLLVQREAALAGFIVVFCVVLTSANASFFTVGNIEAVLLGVSVEGMIAVGMTVLLASGGFDLSVGSVLAFGGVVGGLIVLGGVPAPAAILLAVVVCAAIGVINGFLIAKVKINCFIVTLGALSVVQGGVLLAGGGFGITNLPSAFTAIGQKSIATVQLPIIIVIVLAIIGDFLLRRGRVFRYAYYVGSNERAARLTGIPVERVQMLGYVLTAALAGFAGVVQAARFGSASVEVGQTTPLDVIAAVVIGGASLAGGSGTVLGSMLGVLLLQLIINALNLLGVATYWQPIASGLVLIVAVGFDVLTGRFQTSRLRARLARLRSGT
ncbi:MAG: ABC transporter permease [Actinobacteria bacterium]|nr:ABC transporter permease [Actinomycetota bacterium]MBO0814232.1 ABC transporter permease [Actinomycetota bacterium]